MRIQLMSDLHLESGNTVFLKNNDVDVLVLAGDISEPSKDLIDFLKYATDTYKYVIMVAGNHEYYGTSIQNMNNLLESLNNALPNFYFLNNSACHLEHVNFLGSTLWSSPNSRAFANIPDGKEITHIGHPLSESDMWSFNDIARGFLYDQLRKSQDQVKIVITHFGPHPDLMHPKWMASVDLNTYFWSTGCERSLMLADYWLFGHTHDAIDKVLFGCRCLCNPRGHRYEPTNFNDNLIIEV